MTLFDYRLVENYYRNRMEWEDGPGSLQNVVSDKRIRVVRTWDKRDEDFAHRLIKSGLTGLEQDSLDGWRQYSYHLERLEEGRWRFMGTVDALSDPEDEWY